MAGIKDISDLIKDTPRDIDPGFSIDIFEGMSEEEKKRFKKQMEFMLRGFAIDPYKGKSEEEIKKIKERNRIQRIIRERQREEMGLPEGIQLLNQGGMMDINRMTAPLGYKTGGPTGTYELTKEDADLLGMDPSIIESGENIISKDSDEYIKLMEIKPVGVVKGLAQDLFRGLGQIFGGRGAEGSEIPPKMELELLNNQLRALQGLPGSTLLPSNQDQIKRLEDRIQEIKIDLYK